MLPQMTITDVFTKNLEAVNSGKRFIINQGGTSSSKTYSILQLLIVLATKKDLIISIVAETIPHLRRGAMRDFYKILKEMELYGTGKHNKTDNSFRLGGSLIEFFSGDAIEKMKGSRRDVLFCNEANGMSYDVFDQLEVRTSWLVFIDFNPVAEFWAHKLLQEHKEDCVFIKSTYRDNPFLSQRIIESIERHKDNEYWWLVYGLGEIGIREGLVLPYFEMVDEIPPMLNYNYGMDFGYTNSPTTLVKVAYDLERNQVYWKEIFYESGLKFSDIIDRCRRNFVQPDRAIVCDSEDPRLIAELQTFEFHVVPARKTKVKDEIEVIKRYHIKVTKDSLNLIRELRNYMYKKDKITGEFLNDPVRDFDHCIDAARYAMISSVRPTSGGSIFQMSVIR